MAVSTAKITSKSKEVLIFVIFFPVKFSRLTFGLFNNKDNQLDKAIQIVLKDLKNKDSVLKPDFKDKPDLKLP